MKVKLVSEEKIHTEKPIEELWLQLRLFESEFYSRQFLKEKYPDASEEELNKLSVIFSSNIKQAYEYYSAASHVSILTSPLLYYYGMMCLTNVLWHSLNKTNDISEDHGLYSNSDGSDHLLSNEYVKVHKKGSFPALHSCFSEIPIKENLKFNIKDILSLIPDLQILYENIYKESSRSLKLTRSLNPKHSSVFKQNIYDYTIVHNDNIYLQEFSKDHYDFLKHYGQQTHSYLPFDICQMAGSYANNLLDYPFQKSITGEIYFTFPINAENTFYEIPEASAHFMVMHCLGMLVRYEPVKWLQIVSGKLSSDINLISQFIEVSKRKFPNVILNGLLGKEVQFIMAEDNYVKSETFLGGFIKALD